MIPERLLLTHRSEKQTLTPYEQDAIQVILERNTHLQKMDAASLENFFFRAIRTHRNENGTVDLFEHFDDIKQAYDDMTFAHEGQPRELSGQPYKVHPTRVALLTIDLLEYLDMEVTPEAVIGALKHDMVEDGKEKGITHGTIQEQSRHLKYGHLIVETVKALTREEVDGKREGHKQAFHKVWEEHKRGVRYAQVTKTGDRIENLRDQPGVARPPIHEYVLVGRDVFRSSDYGKWKKTEGQTKYIFEHVVTRDNPRLRGVVRSARALTKREIRERPRRSIFAKKAAKRML